MNQAANFRANVVADSIGPHGIRLTTVELLFPRLALADITRHRAVSFSIESSRAVPIEAKIEQVRNDPYMPVFLQRAKGMGGGDPMEGDELAHHQGVWLQGAAWAAETAEGLLETSKQHANRVLENYTWTRGLLSATEWENLFNLRIHPAAMPELQQMGIAMRDAMALAPPKELGWGEWHRPYVTDEEAGAYDGLDLWLAYGSAGRCATTSYGERKEEPMPFSVQRWQKKLEPFGHWSPGEHPARVPTEDEWGDAQMLRSLLERLHRSAPEGTVLPAPETMEFWGNYRGWVQLRKHYPGEAVFHG